MTTALLANVLATNNFGDTREGDGPAGPIALLMILVLAAVTIFLVRNMNSRLRRLPDRFAGEAPGGRPEEAAEGGPAATGAAGVEPAAPAREGGNVG